MECWRFYSSLIVICVVFSSPRLAAASDVRPDDTVSRSEHESVREQLEAEVSRLTQLLQGALRKQDEMALEAAEAWQKVRGTGGPKTSTGGQKLLTLSLLSSRQARESGAEREALQELATSREEENQTLSSRLAESQDGVSQLKQLVENHVASEREKNKRVRTVATATPNAREGTHNRDVCVRRSMISRGRWGS